MNYIDIIRENRRLTILAILHEDPDYRANDDVLQTMLRALGLDASADQVRGDLVWLEEQGLVTTETVGPYTVAVLTQRGADCSQGRCRVPGVARPRPRG